MDYSRVIPVVCIALVIVVGVNAAVYAALHRGNEASQVDLLRRAAKTTRRPWAEEDDNLQELSRRVTELKEIEKERQTDKGNSDRP